MARKRRRGFNRRARRFGGFGLRRFGGNPFLRFRRRLRGRNRRRRGFNPGSSLLARPLAAVRQGFDLNTLSRAGIVVAGALGNQTVSALVANVMPIDFLKRGPGAYVTGLATAGLLSAGVGMVRPQLAAPVLFGGVLEVVMRAVNEYVMPLARGGVKGLGDYLSVADASRARSLGDYLSVGDARQARPLGYGSAYYGDEVADM